VFEIFGQGNVSFSFFSMSITAFIRWVPPQGVDLVDWFWKMVQLNDKWAISTRSTHLPIWSKGWDHFSIDLEIPSESWSTSRTSQLAWKLRFPYSKSIYWKQSHAGFFLFSLIFLFPTAHHRLHRAAGAAKGSRFDRRNLPVAHGPRPQGCYGPGFFFFIYINI